MQKPKSLTKNEAFGHFLELRLLDGLNIAYDGSPKCFSTIALVRGHANKVKAKE